MSAAAHDVSALRDVMASFATTYLTVLVAELVGDKTLYTLGTLATRFRPGPILAGAAAAFALKMTAAVLFGSLIADLPPTAIAAIGATTFFAMAIGFLFKRPTSRTDQAPTPWRFSRAALAAFATILLPEWGDPGQLAAAILVAQHHDPLVVWSAATLAMATKATLAAMLGLGLRRIAPQRAVRMVSIVLCTAMGIMALFRIDP